MTREEVEARIAQLSRALDAFSNSWPALSALIGERIADHTNSLISENNEQTRGAIKELRALLDLPEALQHEREALTAALSDEDAAL